MSREMLPPITMIKNNSLDCMLQKLYIVRYLFLQGSDDFIETGEFIKFGVFGESLLSGADQNSLSLQQGHKDMILRRYYSRYVMKVRKNFISKLNSRI